MMRYRPVCCFNVFLLFLLLTLQSSRYLAEAAIASNTACECTSSCGTGLLSASKAWCYVNPATCGVGTCSCLSVTKKPYDYCDDSLGLLYRERSRSQTEIDALKRQLDDLKAQVAQGDSTEQAQEAALKEKDLQQKELESVIASQRSTVAVVAWYALWCAVAIAAVVSVLCVLYCGYKTFLLRKRTKHGITESTATEPLLTPPARTNEKHVDTPSTQASPSRLPPETPSDVFPLHKTSSPPLGNRNFDSPFLASNSKVSAGTGTPGSGHEAWSDEELCRDGRASRSRNEIGTPRLGSDNEGSSTGPTRRGSFMHRLALHKPEIRVEGDHGESSSGDGMDRSTRAYYTPSLSAMNNHQ
ncbi:hypothetical protein FOL47_007290 [Perkinsus chesapeaki]|uniref:Uncharacterized protein n=1 Tax=Perkinsus chesapeaki TaxID=330153 RepID=A0A7J6LLK2_PERCH|nr:hypothetical protein FOL47_007290 [Perkinsus chesapeaki]